MCAAIGVWSKCGRLASPPPNIARRGGSSSGSRTNRRRAGGIPFILFTAALCVGKCGCSPPLPTILWKTGLEVEMLATTVGREPVCFSLLDFCSRRLPSSRRTDGIQECTPGSLSSLSKKLSSAPTGKKKKNVFQAFLSSACPAQYKNTKLCSLYQEGGRAVKEALCCAFCPRVSVILLEGFQITRRKEFSFLLPSSLLSRPRLCDASPPRHDH